MKMPRPKEGKMREKRRERLQAAPTDVATEAEAYADRVAEAFENGWRVARPITAQVVYNRKEGWLWTKPKELVWPPPDNAT